MGKALVLKNGVDFSANAVTTIEFSDIPCTGITFAQNTYTISGYDDVTVEYTVAPIDTTDSVIWSSSNTGIVSISNGVMTINGIGTCTVTATCGEFSATATVTVNIAYIPSWAFGYPNHVEGKTFVSFSPTRSRLSPNGDGVQKSVYGFAVMGGGETLTGIKFPLNTAQIRISRGADQSGGFYSQSMIICFMSDEPCGDSSYPNAALYVSDLTQGNLKSSQSVTVDIPTGVDIVGVRIRLASSAAEGTDPNTLAESLGLTIEFIPAE